LRREPPLITRADEPLAVVGMLAILKMKTAFGFPGR
jgi:hypothetical protein